MNMHSAIASVFEEDIQFRLSDGTFIEGSIFIGETPFLPVELLREDTDAYRVEFGRWLNDWLTNQEDRRERILKLHGNSKRYTDLRQAVAQGQVVPFVGSGMSVPSGLPQWSDLLRRIRKFTKVRTAKLEALISNSAFEEAADLLAAGTNANLLNERVEHDLRTEDSGVISGAIRLLPAIFRDLVITTNLDDVLEKHYAHCNQQFTHVLAGHDVSRYRQIKSRTERFLLKLHGDCRRSDTRVLLTAEYERAYGNGSVISDELTLLYRFNHLLFLGCSLGPDRTVKLVEQVARADKNMPRHYALLALPSRASLRIEKESILTAAGIYPIWYDGSHDEAIMALLAGLLEE